MESSPEGEETINMTPSSTESLSRPNEALVESANVPDLDEITPVPTINVHTAEEHELRPSLEHDTVDSSSPSSSSRRPSIARSVSAPATTDASSNSSLSMREHITNFANRAGGHNTNESEEDSGKWQGCSNVSREANLRFARRCMAVLTADAPRQTEFVMHKGMRYKLVVERRGMVPDSSIVLPSYESHKSFGNTRVR